MSEQDYDFLEEEAPEEVVPDVEATPEPIAETVEAVQPETPAPEVTTTPEPAEERVPLAAVMAERHKRQEAERRLAEYERQQQEPQPTFYEQPEQFVQQIERQATQRLHAALEATARDSYPDYDEVLDDVKQFTDANPVYVDQIMAAPNPVLAAYKFGLQIREMQKMQDPAAYRQSIEAEVRAKVEAEYRDKEAAKRQAADAVPPDLSAVRSSRDSEVMVDDSLDSILSSRKK